VKKGWHVAIELPPVEKPRRVKPIADDWDYMRLIPLRGGGGRFASAGDSIELEIPADGLGWFFLLNPIPSVSVREYRPKTLFKLPNNTPKKAKFPVVDIHAHLRGVTAEQRLAVMDAVGVAIVIDSPLGGTPTQWSHERFEAKYPDRFMTFAGLNFGDRFDDSFSTEIVGKLRVDVESMQVPGIAEVIDKGSGVFSNALIPEPA
jgi:hypothetical protein